MIAGTLLEQESDQVCSICWKNIFQIHWYAHCPSCSTNFHPPHLKIWLNTHDFCPKCRTTFSAALMAHYRLRGQEIKSIISLPPPYLSSSLDLTKNQAPSKLHRSYFDNKLEYNDHICTCEPFKNTLLGKNTDLTKTNITGYFLIISFLLFYILYLAFVFVGGLSSSPDKFLYVGILSEIAYFPLLWLSITLFIYLNSRKNCKVHHLL